MLMIYVLENCPERGNVPIRAQRRSDQPVICTGVSSVA